VTLFALLNMAQVDVVNGVELARATATFGSRVLKDN
jgi:hypothetical protein